MCDINSIKDEAVELGCDVRENELMSRHTTFKIGGPADLFLLIKDIRALVRILMISKEYGVPFFLLGKGSNVLVSDNGIRGVVAKLTGDFSDIHMLSDDTVMCGAATSLAKLANFALKHSLSGMEFATGIPGTVGGAAVMNAGAYGSEMKDVLLSCYHLSSSGGQETLLNREMQLGYRSSVYMSTGNVITSLEIKLTKGDPQAIRQLMDEYTKQRLIKQPVDCPSAGSVFKRPRGYFAGTMIQECGLKGKSIGGACVSEKHAGFIINKGGATCSDVIALIDLITQRVAEKYGVVLEREIRLLGEI